MNTAAFDVVRVVDTLAAIVQAASLEPRFARRAATLRQLDRLAAEFLQVPDGPEEGDVLDRFARWLHAVEDRATKSRIAAVLSHCARFTGRRELADRLRVRALNQAEQVEQPAERARLLIDVANQLSDVDKDDTLHEAVLRAESIIHTLEESETRRELTVAVAHALAVIGEPEEATSELRAALLPGSRAHDNGAVTEVRNNGAPVIDTPQGRFTDPTAGLVAPVAHRRTR